MKLEVGMYIRTDNGYISKILEFEKHYTKGKRKVDYCSVKEVVENYLLLQGKQCEIIESIDYSIPPCYPSDEELEKIKSHIVKTSHNIIDLIEKGDYVNGMKVYDIRGTRYDKNDLHCYCNDNYRYNENYELKQIMISAKDIKSIVTHEQFENLSYKIGE